MFIAEFTTILLYELPVALDSLVFMGFSMKLIHDLNTHTTHSTAKMLYNVKAKLFSQAIVRAKHIHSNNFDATSDGSIIFKKVISDDSLCSSLKNSDDIEIVKILRNEAHLSLCKSILIPRHNLRKTRKIMFKVKIIELTNNS
ncbi:Uncharacterised protein [Streptococcus pneumoniae]|uniref:Uncharacterized protein n=1 Tax=Streptococcus pneumoniae TaxID=1313 RepID=A0A4H9G613_STREE|nr:Uncharacterised protein [Streptococcus pneumoniae]VJY64671.1 Uncharacterised protein [Streptococcus pneumoniae]VJZ19406.1 Uncharacterised protein [Streptococcus pneumoniae]VMD03414.1 Uncharacterised protein [Streptococcus pneumoniae]VMF69783.1 Uncharacterised protein [Streptococcus pneumoniae]